MLFRTYGQAVLTLHERTSRRRLAGRPPGKAAAPIAHALTHLLTPMPPHGRQTVPFDNGTEFACHHYLHALDIETFFCDPYAPWQKGGGENASAACAAPGPAKPTWPPSQTSGFITWSMRTTTPRGSASGIPHPRRFLSTKCCT